MPESLLDRFKPLNPQNLRAMFDGVSSRYDLLNRFLSLGRDNFWRKALARRLMARDFPGRFLDLATGSGDQLLATRSVWPQAELTGLDFSGSMLGIAKEKIARHYPQDEVDLILGDACDPPFEDESFDSVSISFGLRNLPKRQGLYEQAFRILKPGGRFLALELFYDDRGPFARFHRLYLEVVTPWIAAWLFKSQNKAYTYLSRSILSFPHPAVIADELQDAGFRGVDFETYTFGSTMLVWGQKPLPC
ncbi:MAG: ubiquinone/menaquinone biosynthesis methyltransferase [Deltaproteobacteria bacterium]|jgi:demethylmenaquinone methyltransferase/2-methoxy-6-polyprenyl-1,4-benzoquinol methylase|nr:ubiquinone/menaquinone biosynthesis methyltransferase [Deltaproteobacteria bacterium]